MCESYLENVKCDIPAHPPYSSDLAPSNATVQTFRTKPSEEVKNCFDERLTSQNQEFFRM